jgi:hypothetical protein
LADYNLSALSARSFEQLIQVIASKVIGPGIVIFGDGPDGGREATYEGSMPFPSIADPWAGYVVIQAKFLQRIGSHRSNLLWLTSELRKELRAFATKARRRRPPDYYILATNIILTPVGSKGGKDKISAEFKKARKFRDWRVWDYDQLKIYLDGNEEVRRKYLFITPDDVLAEVFQQLKEARPNFDRVMTNFLSKELIADQ